MLSKITPYHYANNLFKVFIVCVKCWCILQQFFEQQFISRYSLNNSDQVRRKGPSIRWYSIQTTALQKQMRETNFRIWTIIEQKQKTKLINELSFIVVLLNSEVKYRVKSHWFCSQTKTYFWIFFISSDKLFCNCDINIVKQYIKLTCLNY